MSPYDALAAIAERELELVSAGAMDELPGLRAQRSAVVAMLPETPPADAKPALERTAQVQARISAILEERLQQTGAELRRLTKGRTAMRGYAPPVEPQKLVDQAG